MLIHPTKKSVQITKIESLEERRLMSVTYGSNLILNPGAEAYDGSADGFDIIVPNHWTEQGDATVVQYRSGYGLSILVGKPANAGDAFFAGGPNDETTNFFQTIDLSSISTAVDAGQVSFKLGAAIGGHSNDDDNATVSVNFRDASGNLVSQISTAAVTPGDRNRRSKFIGRSRQGAVPANIRFAQIQIRMKRDDGSYNDGFADNLSLVLATSTPSTVGITPTIVKSTFKPSVISGQKISGGLALNLTNTSTSINKGIVTTTLIASSTGVVDSSSVVVGTVNRSFDFGAGKSAPLTVAVKALTLPAGTYTIFAQTKDALGTVVTTPSGPSVTVAAPFVALSAVVGAVLPITATGGKAISFTLTLTNTGNINSVGAATITIGLTSDGSTVAVPLTTLLKGLTVKSGGKPLPVRLKVKLPIGVPAGVFKPIVTFTQGGNAVAAVGAVPFTIA